MMARILAIVSLVCTALFPVAIVFLAMDKQFHPVAWLVTFALLIAGGWLVVSKRGRLRGWGWLIVSGAAVLVVILFYRDWRALVILVPLLVVAFVSGAAAYRAATRRMLRSDPWKPVKPVLICNPKSGGGKVETFNIVAEAEAAGVEVVVLHEGADLEQLARDAIANGADCIGMAGGDGSQALVASVAIEHDIPFVVISAGTRNHFALDLGLNRDDPRTGLIAFTEGVERRIDYGTINGRLFVNNVSFGLYAAVVEREGYREAKIRTALDVLPDALDVAGSPFDLTLELPSGDRVTGWVVLLVSNNPYVTSRVMNFAQRPVMNSGELGIITLTSSGNKDPNTPAKGEGDATSGRRRSRAQVKKFKGQSLQVLSRSDQVSVGIDGETVEVSSPVTVRSHPRGLRLLVPQDSLRVAELHYRRQQSLRGLWNIALGIETT